MGNLKKASKTAIWPRKEVSWIEDRTMYISIPFTWNIPRVIKICRIKSPYYDKIVIGGPAVYLLPEMFNGIPNLTIKKTSPGVLQRINPMATRTTLGCIRACKFCAVRSLEGKFRELDEWYDGTIICDNNLTAASQKHFDKVIDRLVVHGWADFNQGLDSRLLTAHHAKRIAEIKEPIIKLALDSVSYSKDWENAFNLLIQAGVQKKNIHTLVLIGFDSGPDEAWNRAEFIKSFGMNPYLMWFHELNTLTTRTVTENQKKLGWTQKERVRIFGYYYGGRGNPIRPFVRREIARKSQWDFQRRIPK